MLPRWRDEIRVLLTPHRAGVQRHGRGNGSPFPAAEARVEGNHTLDWRPAIDTLDALLAGLPARGARASVVLSSHFVRYALVPASPLLVTHDDDLRFARHNFVRVHGDAAERWSVRVSREGDDAAVASAIEPDLIDALREVFARRSITPAALLPALMAAVNGARRLLPPEGALLLAVEPGIAVSAAWRGGWKHVRSQRLAAQLGPQLRRLVEREQVLEETITGDVPVIVLPLEPVAGADVTAAGEATRWIPALWPTEAPAAAAARDFTDGGRGHAAGAAAGRAAAFEAGA